ncbi:sodium- and chloride-dependent glycine transporter 2 [Octopus bimaculoides]|uniref:sodium- and chloride-dependent glycine transporter 2 n=1 Tax=Octopus bimaculoides TaxID=37653 RepID=UPI0022E3B8F8|nr:sodium- and chloride-dependent glycine transporter 2 [Octopus bimaculoides]
MGACPEAIAPNNVILGEKKTVQRTLNRFFKRIEQEQLLTLMNHSHLHLRCLGPGMIIICAITSIYYNVIIAWVLYYLYSSMHPKLAWSSCNNPWNTHLCYESISLTKISQSNSTLDSMLNSTKDVNVSSSRALLSSVEEYWERHVLNLSPSVNNIGTVRPPLLLCLFLIWLITFLCLAKGIKTSGKVVYVAASLPYIFLFVLLIRGLTLPGSMDGIYYFVKPKWEKVTDVTVWKNAALQILLSIGIGTSALATLSSYNNFHNNCERDAIILPIIDGLTSFLSGLTSFSILGYMAHISGTHLDNVIVKGPGIVFIVYPQALSTFPFAQIWAVLFFAMLVLVGLDSQFGHIQVIVTAITDVYPEKFGNHKTLLTGIVCLVCFLFGIVFITESGLYILQIVDWYCASLTLLLILFLEIIAVAWVYGTRRLENDISLMLGRKPWPVWKPLWTVINPLCVLSLWISSLISFKHLFYGDGTMFPKWTHYVGYGIALLSIIPVPVLGVQQIMKHKGSFVNYLEFQSESELIVNEIMNVKDLSA